MKYRIGQRVRVIKYSSQQFCGVIERIDPILSSNLKRAIGHWYVIRYTETVPYFCEQGEEGLFTNRDIEPG